MKKLTAFLLAVGASLAPATALAVTEAEAQAHNSLVSALKRVGVSVYLDAALCQKDKGISGFYVSRDKALVICNNGSTQMTEGNLDTLRHEAVHVLQDCNDGVLGDGSLRPALKAGAAVRLAYEHGIDLAAIRKAYLNRGADELTVLLEYEAFTIAAAHPAEVIASQVPLFCS